MKADLHMHSVHSDGTYTPFELLEAAKARDLDIIALTDHDTLAGVEEITNLAKDFNIRIIKGFELSTNLRGQSVHILIYFRSAIPQPVYDFITNMEIRRRKRAYLMAKNLIDIYHINFNLEEFMSFGGNLTRGNMIRQIMKDNPTFNKEAAFEKYLSTKSKAYLPSTDIPPKEAVEFFRKYDCLIFIAHPMLYPDDISQEVFDLDIDGIEAIYPRYKYHDQAYYINEAKKRNLLISAGSDFHGIIDFSHMDMGTVSLKGQDLLRFLERMDENDN